MIPSMPETPPTTGYRTDSGSIDPEYFSALYADHPDPWNYETSGYEAEKYAATLRALPRSRYRNALEVGCSIGVLTAALASRCDHLLAIDVAPEALRRAAERCASLEHVTVLQAQVPAHTPPGPFDLVLLSEVGYYLSAPDLDQLQVQMSRHILPGGHLVLVHWTGETDYPLDADQVHDQICTSPEWRRVSNQTAPGYRLDVLERPATPSGA